MTSKCSGCGCSLPEGYKPCYGDNKHQKIEKPSRHQGMRTYRLMDNPEERRFADAWEKNNGNLLAHILDDRYYQGGHSPEPSDRDCLVAATTIQWLGTPVGRAFLFELGYIKKGQNDG